MKNGFLLAMAGSLLALIGPVVLPFVTVLEEETSLAGYQLDTGLASLGLALMGLGLAAWFGRRRAQRAGWPLAGFAGLQLALMAWTYAHVWELVPCVAQGFGTCDEATGGLIADTLVTLDWGMAVGTIGALLAVIGGVLVLLAHPEYGRNARFLRVGLRWQGDTLGQKIYFRRKAVTIGEADYAGFQLPTGGLWLHQLLTPIEGDDAGWYLTLPPQMHAACHIGGQARALHPGDVVRVGRGDAGVIDAGADLTLCFDFMAAESAVLGGNDGLEGAGMAVSFSLAAGMLSVLLFTALMSHRRSERKVANEQLERRASVMIEVLLAETQPEPKPEMVADGVEQEVTAKKAPEAEGAVGEPSQPVLKRSKVPTNVVKPQDVKVKELGINKVLGGKVALTGALGTIMAGDTGELDKKMVASMAGEGTERELGHGPGGLGFRGIGSGGGGPGGYGRVHALGAIDVDGGRGKHGNIGRRALARRVKPGRKVSPIDTERLTSNAFCDKGQLTRVIRQRSAAFRACYEKELLSAPTMRGKVTVTWTINLEGRVERPKVLNDQLHNASVSNCVLRQIRRMRFKEPEGGMCVVRFPLMFSAN